MKKFFHDRKVAGQLLARKLIRFAGDENAVVLSLPRGGVPVGFQIASQLHLPLDVLLVRKLGVPGYEDLAMGVIGSNDVLVLNAQVMENLGLPQSVLNSVRRREQQKLVKSERELREDLPPLHLHDRKVILVDDGIATGTSISAAAQVVRAEHPRQFIIATPVASADSLDTLMALADEVIVLVEAAPFKSVSEWYVDFPAVTTDEVKNLLHQSRPAKCLI